MPAHLLEDYYEDVRWANPRLYVIKEVSLFHGCPNYRGVLSWSGGIKYNK